MSLITAAIDQSSKAWALRSLVPGERIDLIGSFLGLSLIRNPGAAFSIGTGATGLMTAIAVAVVLYVAFSARRVGHQGWAVTIGILLGGAIGNLIDRFFRSPGIGRGHVVDFLDWAGFFVGNLADVAIVGAAVMGAILALRGIPIEGHRAPTRTAGEEVADVDDA